MNSQNIEDISLEELEKKLNEYKTNLSQVEAILEREKSSNPNSKLDEIYKLQKDLKQAIIYQDDVIKFKLQTCNTNFSNIKLTKELNGRICQAFYDPDQKWYTAVINEINEETQMAEITFLGYKEKDSIPAKYIKLFEMNDPEDLEIGMFCDAIFYGDGLWYPAIIEAMSEHGIHVKYKKSNETEVVSLDSIRITPEQKIQNDKRKEYLKNKKEPENETEFKVPDNLKISPADSETQRLTKKKKLKALKNSHKQKLLEKISKDKQDEWLSFSQKNSKQKFNSYASSKKTEDDNANTLSNNLSKSVKMPYKNNYINNNIRK